MNMNALTIVMTSVLSTTAWCQSTPINDGLPAEVYITCANASEIAKNDNQYIADLVAVMGNASVESRQLNINPQEATSENVIKILQSYCIQDPDMLLITAMDKTMRRFANNEKG